MRRSVVGVFALGVVAGAAVSGAFAAAQFRGGVAPGSTQIALIACGISPGPPELDLPIALVVERVTPAHVSLGPLDLAGVDVPVTLRFEAVPDMDSKAPWRKGGLVKLPVRVGAHPPLEQITLRCRHGMPARVSFRYGTEILDIDIAAARPDARGPFSILHP